jgi:hypothetical protein
MQRSREDELIWQQAQAQSIQTIRGRYRTRCKHWPLHQSSHQKRAERRCARGEHRPEVFEILLRELLLEHHVRVACGYNGWHEEAGVLAKIV